METNEYVDGLILAYIKSKGQQYSIDELSGLIGLPSNITIQFIERLIKLEYLQYNECMLEITFQGQAVIQDKAVNYMIFSDLPTLPEHVDPSNMWSFDKVYVPKGFIDKVAK